MFWSIKMELCLGTVQFGTQYGIQRNIRPSKQEVFKIISYALDHGVRWFDTAAAYGTAEELLGDYIEENLVDAEKISIVSKLEPCALTNVSLHKRKESILRNIQGSLDRLNRRQLDAYIFHNASNIFDEDAVDALDCVRQEGLAKSIGVSTYTPQEAMQALTYPQIDVIQIPYNIFDRRLDQCGFFEKAKQKNIKIFARSSLLQGLAVMKIECLPDHMRFAIPYINIFQTLCKKNDISPLQAAVGFVAVHPGISYLVFGVDNSLQLAEYLAAVSRAFPKKMQEELNSAFETVEERLVNPSLWNQ